MCNDVEFLIEKLSNQAGTNQCVVSYQDKCCKINREDYYPDENGLVVFHKKTDWRDEGYSVAEMLEFLKIYGERISEIKFESIDGCIQELINIFEVDNIGVEMEYNCLVLVGKAGEPLKVYHNPQNENWLVDTIHHHF